MMHRIKAIPEDFVVEEEIDLPLDSDGQYTYLLLEKRGYNTEDAIDILARALKHQRKDFSYAGTKDRNAVTRQYISLKGRADGYQAPGISLKAVGRGRRPLSLGDLDRNRFTIVVRDIEKEPRHISFIPNYFDAQRFGKSNLDIGRRILRKDFKGAAELIDFDASRDHLRKYPTDYLNAIRKLPKNIVRMYIHAFQSYLFNEALSGIIRQGGDFKDIEYQEGILAFPRDRPGDISLPLVSFDTKYPDPAIRQAYDILLEKEGIRLSDLIIRSIPELSPHGSLREGFVSVENLQIGEAESDDLTPGSRKVKVSFSLPKGSYATIAIRSMFI